VKTTTIFPTKIFTDTLEIPSEVSKKMISKIDEIKDRRQLDGCNFGWKTHTKTALGPEFEKLFKLVGSKFFNEVVDQFSIPPKNIEFSDVSLMGIDPSYEVPNKITKYSWYTAVVFIQTTDKGSHLYFENYSKQMYGTPKGVEEYSQVVKPKKNRLVFYPSHLVSGFTPNFSLVENIIFTFNIIGIKG
jgi:hypothetical protein